MNNRKIKLLSIFYYFCNFGNYIYYSELVLVSSYRA
jgi:hypothetical protein